MNFFKKLLTRKDRGPVSTITVNLSNETLSNVETFVNNCKSMDDCKIANTMIDDLNKPFKETYQLRNKLSDITFDTFKK